MVDQANSSPDKRKSRIINWLVKTFAVLLIALILISPYFLLLNFDAFAPIVLTVWMLSAAYYVFVKARSK